MPACHHELVVRAVRVPREVFPSEQIELLFDAVALWVSVVIVDL
jgi:hypothetical protein